jgi:hypothetical protein
MIRVRQIACAGLVVALRVFATATVAAAGPGPDELKASADAAFDRRSYAGALEQYRAALAQGGDPRIHYNVAQTLTALERYPEALLEYQAFLSEAPAGTLTAAQQEKFFALLDELKAKITRLDLRCTVPGARVLVRDKALGTTPLEGPVSVNAGPAKIEVIAEGFKPFVATVALRGGTTQAVEVPLERIDFSGTLSVHSNVPEGRTLVDGTDRGATPLVLRVDRGTHTVVVQASGYVEQRETVSVDAGGRREVSFTMRRSPDYTLAYVGAGVGFVGVAAGTLTGILAFTSLGAAKGQCDPSTKACGPAAQSELQTSTTYGVVSTIAFVTGATGLAVGVYGWIRARRGGLAKPAEVVVLPGGLGLRGEF